MTTIITDPKVIQELITRAVQDVLTTELPKIARNSFKKLVYSIPETCDLLSCTRRHLQYLRSTRQIGYVQNGRKILFRAEDLESFFNDHYIKGGRES